MPDLICVACVHELDMAYRFRTNCESSDAILKSFVDTAVLNDIVNKAGAGVVSVDEGTSIIEQNDSTIKRESFQLPTHPMNDQVMESITVSEHEVGDADAVDDDQASATDPDPAAADPATVTRLMPDDAIIEGVEFLAGDHGMLKLKVLGQDEYVEYRVVSGRVQLTGFIY